MGITLHKTAKKLNKILWVTNANKMKSAAAIILSSPERNRTVVPYIGAKLRCS